jgi:hypothetical protein
MADWNLWKEKTKNLTMAGVSKAKDLGEITRLNLNNLAEEEKMKQAYLEIGMRYAALHQDAPEEGYELMFEKLALARDAIKANKEQIARLKTEGNLTDEDLVTITSKEGEE